MVAYQAVSVEVNLSTWEVYPKDGLTYIVDILREHVRAEELVSVQVVRQTPAGHGKQEKVTKIPNIPAVISIRQVQVSAIFGSGILQNLRYITGYNRLK